MTADHVLPCGADMRALKLKSKLDLQDAVQEAHMTLQSLLGSLLLLLREPWARNMRGMVGIVGSMFSTIVRQRMAAVKCYLSNGIAAESELVDILLKPLLPIIIDYEREGNTEGQTVFAWSGPAGLIDVSPALIARAESNLHSWTDSRRHGRIFGKNYVLVIVQFSTLGTGWPGGLPIHFLATDEAWEYHALVRPEEAPFLSSRVHEVIFSPRDIIVAAIPHSLDPKDKFVDSYYDRCCRTFPRSIILY